MPRRTLPYRTGRFRSRRLAPISLAGAVALTAQLAIPANAMAASRTPISMWFFNLAAQDNFLQSGLKVFERQHPSYTINFQDTAPPTGTGGLEDKLTAAFATGSAPDIIPVISTDADEYISNHLLLPFTNADAKLLGYSSVAGMESSFQTGVLAPWEMNGKVYAIPWQNSTLDLACNTAPFKAAGINLAPYANKTMTWSRFIKLGEQVVKANPGHYYKNASGQWVHNLLKLPIFQDDTWAMQVLTMFEAQAGGNVLNGKSVGVASKPSQVAVNEMKAISLDLGDPHLGPIIPGDLFTAFADNQTTCAMAGNFLQPLFMTSPPSPVVKHMVVLKMPTIYPGKIGNVAWGWAFGVNAKTPSSLVGPAWQAIKTTFDRPVQEVVQGGIMGPSDKHLDAAPALKSIVDLKTIEANTAGAQPIFKSTQYPTIAHLLRGDLDAIMLSGAPVASTLQSAASQIASIVKS